MRPSLGWADLAAAGRVGVWGLGVEGRANVAKLRSMGIEPVEADDGRPGSTDLLADCDVVVKTPGISRYRDDVRALEALGVAVVGGLGLWLAEAPLEKVVLVTGTKGKSTTTSIAGHLARNLGVDVVLGGNLGAPPYDVDARTVGVDLWVIEVSSYQATDLPVAPPVVALTSLHPDHLDWHGGDEAYYRDKLSITTLPGARLTVANGEDDRLRARLGGRDDVRWVTADDAGEWAEPLRLIGRHNRTNAAIARAVLVAAGVVGADDDERIARAGEGFAGLASRLRLVRRTDDGVDFVDDSLATNVLPTMAALDAYPDRAVAVILGGHDRGIDYTPLAVHLASRAAPTIALTLPASGDRIADAIAAHAPGVLVERCADLHEAVIRGHAWARTNGGVVLLSPAAPSFGQFRDYADRAAAFEASCEQVASR